jgi:phosphate-selective porin OprO/OprP
MKINRWLLGTIIGTQFAFNSFAADDAATNSTEAAEIEALKQEVRQLDQKVESLENQHQAEPQTTATADKDQIQELDQKVRVLERERELDQQAAADAAKIQPKITLGANGFSFGSADSNFVASLHGLIQTDSRTFFNDGGGTVGKNTFLLRRARPIFTGTVFRDFDFNFTPDFGGSAVLIYDAYLNYHYNPALQLEAGKFKSPVGLEALQSDTWTSFNERSIVSDLVPNRDIGFELHGDLFGGAVSYAAGIFDGAPDYTTPTAPLTTQDADDDKAFAGRLFFQPWKTSSVAALQGLGFGFGGSYEEDREAASGNLSSGFKTDGQQTFFSYAAGVIGNGAHWRISPQGYYYYGPFDLLGEYVISDQEVSRTTAPLASADLRNTAWEISAGWVLTGEAASYNGLTPKHPFDPGKNQWGAWQIVARYANLDVDDAAFAGAAPFAAAGSASGAKAWSVGLNWYLNKNIRVDTSFSRTTFEHEGAAAPTAVTAQPENALFTRVQLSF